MRGIEATVPAALHPPHVRFFVGDAGVEANVDGGAGASSTAADGVEDWERSRMTGSSSVAWRLMVLMAMTVDSAGKKMDCTISLRLERRHMQIQVHHALLRH